MTRRRHQWMYALPNSLTALGMFLGLYAIMLCLDGGQEAVVIAAWWLIIASLMDGLDGAVARMTGTTSNFGIQFDSLADLTTFGIAPAMILYTIVSEFHAQVAVFLAGTFALAGALRLARYNISIPDKSKKKVFQGLPIPAGACVIASLTLCMPNLERWFGHEITRRIITIAPLITAYLMISKIRFITFRDCVRIGHDNRLNTLFQLVTFVIFIYWLFFKSKELLALLIFAGYIIYGLASALVWRLRLFRHHPSEEPEEREAER